MPEAKHTTNWHSTPARRQNRKRNMMPVAHSALVKQPLRRRESRSQLLDEWISVVYSRRGSSSLYMPKLEPVTGGLPCISILFLPVLVS